MKNKHYYVACDAGMNVNSSHRHYYRLYENKENIPTLIDQGLADKIEGWETKYSAVLELTNPYPKLD